MCSASRRFVIRLLILGFVLLAPAAWSQGDPAATDTFPELNRPLGPIPGPSSRPTRESSPYVQDAAAIMQGRRLFVAMNCSGCHGGHAGGGMGPSLRDGSWIYGGKGGDIFDSIAQGRAHGMPAWGTMLPIDVIWKLVAYIETLRTPREAEPPK